MNEMDVLKKISSNLTDRRTTAALSNYKVLCSNISFLNAHLSEAVQGLSRVHDSIKLLLEDNSALKDVYKVGNDINAIVPIVVRVIRNGITLAEKFVDETRADGRIDINIDNVKNLERGFVEYSSLVTATRQFVDSIISDSYQLIQLDPKVINYHVLVSLRSVGNFSTKSLRQALFNSEIEDALNEFSAIRYSNWSNSHITKCQHTTFAQKVDFIVSALGSLPYAELPASLKDLFKFSSEFTHIGYVSTFFTSSAGAEVIFGDDDGPYLPSTENMSELKYEILETG